VISTRRFFSHLTALQNTSWSRPCASNDTSCGFCDFFDNHSQGPGIHKWMSYFSVYEEHFARYCGAKGRPVRMMEIGIQSGGSMLMWQHCFGANLQLLLGVDMNPATKAWEKFGDNVEVEIGSQADVSFLKSVSNKYAPGFDVILDDGSHVPNHMFVTFATMWASVRPGGVFLIEDVHGNNPLLQWILHGHEVSGVKWNGLVYPEGLGRPDRINEDHPGADTLNYFNPRETGRFSFIASEVQDEVESIKVYPYMIAVTKRYAPRGIMEAQRHGTQWIPY